MISSVILLFKNLFFNSFKEIYISIYACMKIKKKMLEYG